MSGVSRIASSTIADTVPDVLGLHTSNGSSFDTEGSEHEKPPIPKSLVRRISHQADANSNEHLPIGDRLDQISNDGPPQVATLEELDTTAPPGGRFVSNTYSYVTAGNTTATNAPASEKVQKTVKVYRCEDEP